MAKRETPDTEKILRRTTTFEMIEKPIFTTESKHKSIINISRKGSITKERCRQLTQIALNLFPDRVIHERDLIDLVKMYVGGNRDTVRDYTGYNGRIISNSYANTKILGVKRKGYLEIFGFMHPHGLRWIIHKQTTLHPPTPPFPNAGESVDKKYSKENISLSPLSSISRSNVERGNGGKPGPLTSGCPPKSKGKEIIYNNNNTVRERNLFQRSLEKKEKHDKILTCPKDTNLAYLEVLAKAKAGEEPDRGSVDWGKLNHWVAVKNRR